MSQTVEKLEFTDDQKEAIKHEKGHLRIIACPGSGKTEVVSQRIAGLIKNGADPKTIVAFTFTEKAAEELKTRIRGILERECPNRADFGDMFVGTIHAFCFHMLKELDPAYRSYDILDEAKRIAFLSKSGNFYDVVELVRLQKVYKIPSRYKTINRFLYSFDIVMMENIDPAELSDLRFQDCIRNYLKATDDEKYFDFSTIIHRLVEVLRHDKEKQKRLGEKVKHVVLDEYQDVNKLQESLLGLLSKNADSVCVVGDDDQTIYNWRGSDVRIIGDFKKRYEKKYDITDVRLGTNFRSTDALVYTTEEFIKHNGSRMEKSMESKMHPGRKFEDGDIVYRRFEEEKDEFDFIARTVRGLEGTDFSDKRGRPFSLALGDFAVLVRHNDVAARVIDHLTKNGIPCIAYNGESVFERPEVSFVLDCIRYVFDCENFDTGEVPETGDLKSTYGKIFRGRTSPEIDPSRFVSGLKKIKSQVDKIQAKDPKDYLGGLGLQEFYFKILNAMGAEDLEFEDPEFEDMFHYNMAVLSRAISDYESVWIRLRTKEIEGFFYFVAAYARSRYSEIQHSDSTIINAVRVLTMHKAKGLEFPAVFVPSFRKRRKPRQTESFVDAKLYHPEMYYGNDDDERRIYYTAFTRAEKYLFITNSVQIPTNKRDVKPHPFLDQIPKKHVSDRPAAERPRSGHQTRAESFQTYHASFSKLSSYSRCPHDFKLRHIYGYNAGVPVTFGYGANIHNALNVIHSDYILNQKIPSDGEIDLIFDRIFKLRYATTKIAENMKRSGLNIVKNYVKLHKHDFKRILESEKNFEFVLDEALVSGQIDLLKKTDDQGNVTEVEIIDFKSEKKDGAYKADHERQLRYYAIACLTSLGLKPKKAYVHHLDDGTRDHVDISDRYLEETGTEIGLQIKSILGRKFPPKPAKKRCSECDYKTICAHKKFTVGVEGRAEST